MHLVLALVCPQHDMIESPFDADKMCATPSPGLNLRSMMAFDCLTLQADAGVDWDLAVVQPLLHVGKDLPAIHINRLSARRVEICLHVL
jgi:hypothetical protein